MSTSDSRSETIDPHSDEIRSARMRAGRAIRDLGHTFVGRHMTVEQIDRLSTALESINHELWPADKRRRDQTDLDFVEWGEIPQGQLDADFSDRPISGGASPWGLDLDVSREGDEIVAVTSLRPGHEGAPGRSHGGIVAALFDDVMGFVLGVIRQPAFTGELTVRYEAPTPLGRPLECRARATGRDGRKIFLTAELTDIDRSQVVARAKATFITIGDYGIPTAERPAPPDAH